MSCFSWVSKLSLFGSCCKPNRNTTPQTAPTTHPSLGTVDLNGKRQNGRATPPVTNAGTVAALAGLGVKHVPLNNKTSPLESTAPTCSTPNRTGVFEFEFTPGNSTTTPNFSAIKPAKSNNPDSRRSVGPPPMCQLVNFGGCADHDNSV